MYNFPLELTFKLAALSPQISVTDANGKLLFYVKQKLFKLKEAITIFADESQTQPLYYINANKILDFSAAYTFTDVHGNTLGSVRRNGMKSFWKSHFDVYNQAEAQIFTIRENNPWIKVADSLLGEIPVLGMFTGFFFHPSYNVTRLEDEPVLKIHKKAAFFEGKFTIEKTGSLHEKEELPLMLSIMMMVLLERHRG